KLPGDASEAGDGSAASAAGSARSSSSDAAGSASSAAGRPASLRKPSESDKPGEPSSSPAVPPGATALTTTCDATGTTTTAILARTGRQPTLVSTTISTGGRAGQAASSAVADAADRMSVALTPLARLDPPAIARHVHALRAEVFARRFRPLLARVMENPLNGGVFNSPVDPVRLGIPDYPTIVRNPMDLGTIRQRLEALRYTSTDSFAADIRLVFANAIRYNPATHQVHVTATKMREDFDRTITRHEAKADQDAARKASHSCGFCHGSVCGLCGEKCLKFDPPVLSCDCCGGRIRRGDTFYRASDGHRWCVKCVNTGGMSHSGPGTVPAPTAVVYAFLADIKEATAGCRSIAEAALAVRRKLPRDVAAVLVLAARVAMQEEARAAQLTRIRVARRAAAVLALQGQGKGSAAAAKAARRTSMVDADDATNAAASLVAAEGSDTPSSNAILANLLRQEAFTGLGPAEAIPLGTRAADAAVRSIALARAALAVSAPDTAGTGAADSAPDGQRCLGGSRCSRCAGQRARLLAAAAAVPDSCPRQQHLERRVRSQAGVPSCGVGDRHQGGWRKCGRQLTACHQRAHVRPGGVRLRGPVGAPPPWIGIGRGLAPSLWRRSLLWPPWLGRLRSAEASLICCRLCCRDPLQAIEAQERRGAGRGVGAVRQLRGLVPSSLRPVQRAQEPRPAGGGP
ncbi:GTE12, partial [Symbiodinium sp. KB8]